MNLDGGAIEVARRRHRAREAILPFGLFAVLFALFYASPVHTPFDSRWAVHTAMSFARGHWGDLSEYMPILEREGLYAIEFHKGPRALFPIGVSLLSVPAVAAISLVRPAFNGALRYAIPVELEGLLAAAFGALIGALFWWAILIRFDNRYIALGCTVLLCFCTSVWSTASRALWQHTAVVLMYVLAMGLLFGARTRPSLIQYLGLPLAMSFVSRPTAAVAVVIFSLYVLTFYRRWFLRYVLWSLLLAVPWIVYNFFVYDFAFPPYYYVTQHHQDWTVSEALLGNLFSPSRGLFIYSPILLIALPGFVLSLREPPERWLHVAFAAVIVVHWFIVSSYASPWWGGHCYGPRFMTDVLPFLVYFLAFTFAPLAAGGVRQAAAVGGMLVLAGVSLFMHAQGALNWAPYRWNSIPRSIDSTPERLWDWRDPQFARGGFIRPRRAALLNLTGGVVPADLKLYESGVVWWFQAGQVDPLVLRSGWAAPEAWGVWSDGHEARLMLDPRPALVGTGELLLLVRATAFTAPRHPRQQVDVLVNETPLTVWTWDVGEGASERRARISTAVVKFPLAITFRLHNPISPAELGGSADPRRLGIGLTSLRLAPARHRGGG